MITLSPATVFLLYLATSLAILLFLWVRSTARARRRRIIPPEHTLIQCEYCSERYFALADRRLTRCPQCHLVLKISSRKARKKSPKVEVREPRRQT